MKNATETQTTQRNQIVATIPVGCFSYTVLQHEDRYAAVIIRPSGAKKVLATGKSLNHVVGKATMKLVAALNTRAARKNGTLSTSPQLTLEVA